MTSTTGLYIRKARSRPSKPGIAKPAVIMTLPRCGSSAPLVGLVMSVFDSVAPVILTAFFRFTVPTIGLVTWNSLCGPYGSCAVGAVLKSVGCAKPCCTAAVIALTISGTATSLAAARSICALVISK